MDYQIIWSRRALNEVEAAVRYVAADDPAAAERLLHDLFASAEILARFPLIGPAFERDRTGRTREILCHPYRVFYRCDHTTKRVQVVTVWHGSRRDPPLPR